MKSEDITGLLQAWSAGDESALDMLIPLVFEELRRMAAYFFQREREDHTLAPTALVSELYLLLRRRRRLDWDNRASFFNFAAEVMRHFLVDYARRHRSSKRGGEAESLPLSDLLEGAASLDFDLVALHNAIEKLADIDPRQAKVVELRFFVGLGIEEIASILKVSDSTVKREWRTARFWLKRELAE